MQNIRTEEPQSLDVATKLCNEVWGENWCGNVLTEKAGHNIGRASTDRHVEKKIL